MATKINFKRVSATRINLTETEIQAILSWGFSDFKANEEYDKKLLLKLHNALKRLYAEDIWDEWVNPEPNVEDIEEQEELERRKKGIEVIDGIFFCPKCNLRTNKKTPETKCVICDTVLQRVGGH